MAPGVSGPKANYLPAGAGLVWSIPSYVSNKSLAWKYINFVTTVKAQQTLLDVGSVLPTDIGVKAPASAPPQLKTIIQDLNTNPTSLYPHALWNAAVLTAYGKEVQLVIDGQESVDTAMQNVQNVENSSLNAG
jgi:ABC-type glycerol-3-phosphate transport system substrate-binding protein